MSVPSNGVATTSSSPKMSAAAAAAAAVSSSSGILNTPVTTTGIKQQIHNNETIGKGNNTAQGPDPATAALRAATSPSEVRASLANLHTREFGLVSRLSTLLASHQDLARSLSRLDNLRAGLGAQVIAARSVSNTMLVGAAETASHLSSRVRALDLEKQRVEDTLRVVEQVAELKACVAGVVGSMGAPQDWEAAAGYIARAARVPEEIVRGGFATAVVPTVEVPDAPWVTLENAKESLCGLFLREFEKAAAENDGAKVTRFFKLFPLIGRGDTGLDVYGRYVCQGVAGTARAVLKEAGAAKKDGFFFANALTRLFEHIAHIVDGHGALVERHYGAGKMVKVIERLQMEADVQGGIILDSWSDDRTVDRRLTDTKSYPFTFLVQSFMPKDRGFNTSRVNSPALGGGANTDARNSEDEGGVSMKEVDALLSEIAIMLGRWSLYSRFLAGKCRDPDASDETPLTVPEVLVKSNLSRKVSGKLITPYNDLTAFFFRRSVEKAFQMDEHPSGLSLKMNVSIDSEPPFVTSAVDDVMYIVKTVILRSISTSQRAVVDSVLTSVSNLLASDFIGMIQRKMRDDCYPKASIQNAKPPDDKVIAFIVLINSLDVANEYLTTIIRSLLTPPEQQQTNGAAAGIPGLHNSFPFKQEAKEVTAHLNKLHTSFTSLSGELLNEGVRHLFSQVIKPQLRPVLSETFRDADYTLTEDEFAEFAAQQMADTELTEEMLLELAPSRFERHWNRLMLPIKRIMTERTYAAALEQTAIQLARMLEKRVWSYGTSGTSSSSSSSSGNRSASPWGAIRMERDFGAIVGTISRGNYAVRELFARTTQILMVANMDDEEWDEMVAMGSGDGDGEDGMVWVLSEEERRRARTIVRTD